MKKSDPYDVSEETDENHPIDRYFDGTFKQEVKGLVGELIDIPCGVYRMGMGAVVPLTFLIGLALLIGSVIAGWWN